MRELPQIPPHALVTGALRAISSLPPRCSELDLQPQELGVLKPKRPVFKPLKQVKSLIIISSLSEHFANGTCGIVDITGYVFVFLHFILLV